MRSDLLWVGLFGLGVIVSGCATEPGEASSQAPQTALDTEDQKILYTLGQFLGQDIQGASLSEDELGPVFLGLADMALGREPRVEAAEYGPRLQAFMTGKIEAAAEAELGLSMAFMDAQADLDGAVRTESGIVIQELEPGTGAQPAASDTVTVHYHGTLRNGTVFDSSVERGEPTTFPLGQVIPCWTEGVQSMRVGGTSRLVCPPDLAYGPVGPPGIPGNAALVFEVELIGIAAN
jgi:FKBP-type peptidyl-prolyl cis-trans isomerase